MVQTIIVIAASAGGPRILKDIFSGMPKLNAGIVLVQHMPKFINQSLQESLSRGTDLVVRIAEHGCLLECGTLYIAPSELHLQLLDNRQIVLATGEKVNYVCPSADVTMLSLRKHPGIRFVGVVLSGMGRDGADGIVHIKQLNGDTIAQDERSSIIFGMPKEAIATGCIDWILPPSTIQNKLIELAGIMPVGEKKSGGFS